MLDRTGDAERNGQSQRPVLVMTINLITVSSDS